jgi:hypothetical protein
MNDPRQPGWSDPTQAGGGYPQNADPAYAGQYYGQGYGPQPTQPTEQLPSYWHQGGGYPPGEPPQPPPGPPKSPKWLWILAGVAVLLVVGLVIALVIVSSSARETTVVAPLPPLSETSSAPPRASTSIPTTTLPPLPTTTGSPGTPTVPGGGTTSPTGTDTVVYNVAGDGRAINITYVDTGGIMQTEFNVMLPWSKEVSLPAPARASASVAVVNVGRDVTCNVSVNGTQVRERTGRGLTICTGAG